VRLIGPQGEQIGIVPTSEALGRARELGLDLVEVSPNTRPPVCRILDFGKYKYELAKRDKISKKKQHAFQLKEMRYRPKIDDHDFNFKLNHIRGFLSEGSKVRAFVMFRGREMAHIEFGRAILDQLVKETADLANVDMAPTQEGNTMNCVLSPKPELLKKLSQQKAQAVANLKKEKTTLGPEIEAEAEEAE
jgi:translation initiation factor IF-3